MTRVSFAGHNPLLPLRFWPEEKKEEEIEEEDRSIHPAEPEEIDPTETRGEEETRVLFTNREPPLV